MIVSNVANILGEIIMGYHKEKEIEDENKKDVAKDKKLKGYEKKIINDEGSVPMYCPNCGYAWSSSDMKQQNCVHGCGFPLDNIN